LKFSPDDRLPCLIDCSQYRSTEIVDIMTRWIGYIDKAGGDKTRRPMFMRYLWLADGARFPKESLDRMREFANTLDATKIEVQAVKKWIEGE